MEAERREQADHAARDTPAGLGQAVLLGEDSAGQRVEAAPDPLDQPLLAEATYGSSGNTTTLEVAGPDDAGGTQETEGPVIGSLVGH